MFLASRPLGGAAKPSRLSKDRILAPLGQRHNASPQELALAALLDAGPHVARDRGHEHGKRSFRLAATKLSLDVSDRTALALGMSFEPDPEALAAARQLFVRKEEPKAAFRVRPLRPLVPDPAFIVPPGAWAKVRPCFGLAAMPEVVMVMGMPGAGKSFLAEDYEGRGYIPVSRGRRGADVVTRLNKVLADRHKLAVIEDAFPTRLSRASVIAAARSHGLPVRCIHLTIPLTEAQFNISLRMVQRYGRLLDPEEMKACRRADRSVVTPADLRRWQRSFEPPSLDEGFSTVDTIPFVRRLNPAYKQKGILLDVDGTLCRTRSGSPYPCQPNDVELLPGRHEVLLRWAAAGYHLFFVSNQSGIAEGKLTREMADEAFQRTAQLLRLPVTEIAYCPHKARPVACWCRKPAPGMGVFLMELHRLALRHLVVVGDGAGNAEFAAALGAKFWDKRQFFRWPGP